MHGVLRESVRVDERINRSVSRDQKDGNRARDCDSSSVLHRRRLFGERRYQEQGARQRIDVVVRPNTNKNKNKNNETETIARTARELKPFFVRLLPPVSTKATHENDISSRFNSSSKSSCCDNFKEQNSSTNYRAGRGPGY